RQNVVDQPQDEKLKFHPDADGNLDLEAVVFQALGAASTCWENKDLEDAGTFDSEEAVKIGNALIEWLDANHRGPHISVVEPVSFEPEEGLAESCPKCDHSSDAHPSVVVKGKRSWIRVDLNNGRP